MEYHNGGWVNNIEELLALCPKPEIKKKFDYRTKRNIEYLNIPVAFDIETSSFYTIIGKEAKKQAIMYIWMLGINGYAIYGRTWAEFLDVIKKIKKFYNITYYRRLVCWIHNLNFEFCWINRYFEWDNIFAREKNQPMRALTTDGIEFRCSLMLSGQGLAGTCRDLVKYKIKKMEGDLDYSKIRHSGTPLSEIEMGYCLNDVLGVMSFVKEEMELVDDDITKVPMTKTGKVRSYIIDHCVKGQDKEKRLYRKLIHFCNVTSEEEYSLMKWAYTGGFTHANYNKVQKCCNSPYYIENVKSWDFTSSYPTTLCLPIYPISSGRRIVIHDVDELKKLSKTNFLLFVAEFKNIVSRHSWEHLFSLSKCAKRDENGKLVHMSQPKTYKKGSSYMVDNGRVVYSDSLIIALCDIDWDTVEEYYDWDEVTFTNAYAYTKGFLPKQFIECVLDFYEGKTKLKDVVSEDGSAETNYQLLKGCLNSCYGAICTDFVSDTITFEKYNPIEPWHSTTPDVCEQIDKYNQSHKRWGFWPWAIACTAAARRNLFKGITEFGRTGDYCYSDTDSVKVTNYEKHMDFINSYNADITHRLEVMCDFYGIDKSRLRPKTVKGKEKPLGVWDDDGFYKRFSTLGAKRYMVEYEDGTIKTTIAGANKKQVSKLMTQIEQDGVVIDGVMRHNAFEFFNDDMVIDENHSGRNIVAYFYEPCEGVVVDYLGQSYHYREESYIHIEKGKYSMRLSDYYVNYIENETVEYAEL